MGMVSGTRVTGEFEMFPILHDNRSDLEELVHNHDSQDSLGRNNHDSLDSLGKNESVNSFISSNNELTITRWINSRKFSMMSFKPSEKNVIDIVVTKGECTGGKETLLVKEIGSRDIRSRYSVKAKAAVITILLLLAAMVFVIVFAMVSQPWNIETDRDRGPFVMVAPGREIFSNITTHPSTGNATLS